MPQSPSDKTPDPDDFVHMATDMMVATQAASMRLFGAEMQAMAHLMPGAEPGEPFHHATDEEIEDGFDNMPV